MRIQNYYVSSKHLGNNWLIVMLVLAVFLPIFAPLYLQPRGINIYNTFNYVIIFMIISVSYYIMINKYKGSFYDNDILPLIVFNIYTILFTFFLGVYENELYEAYRLLNVELASLLIIMMNIYSGIRNEYEKFLSKFSILLGIFFLVQLSISVYESVSGNLLLDRLMQSGIVGSTLDDRDIFSLLGLSQNEIFGYKRTLTGLYPQHNYFATPLALYNIFFLLEYSKQKKKIYLFFIFGVLFAIVGNGSRFGIIAILLSDLYVFYKIFIKKYPLLLKVSGIIIISITIFTMGKFIIENLILFSNVSSRNLFLRFDLWSIILFDIFNGSALNIFFGFGIANYLNYGVQMKGLFISSMESQFITQFYLFGILGFLLFIYVFVFKLYTRQKSLTNISKMNSKLLLLNILICGLIANGIFISSSYVLITLLYLRTGD